MPGLTVGAWLAWPMALLVAGWTGWRLRFRVSAEVSIWRRQAAMQRRTAATLASLSDDGYLVLHDVVLPGSLDSLDHLLVGPTGVWVLTSWRRRRLHADAVAPPGGILRRLHRQTGALAEALDGWARVPVRPLLCVHGRWPGSFRSFQDVRVVTPRQVAGPSAPHSAGHQRRMRWSLPPPGCWSCSGRRPERGSSAEDGHPEREDEAMATAAAGGTGTGDGAVDWQGEYAYTLAVQALIYGFPYVYGAQTRYKWVTQTPGDPEVVPHPAVNRFWHAARLTDATWRDGGSPNNDTLYSLSWVDLSREPVILSHPDMGDRYFTFQLAAMTSDNFDYVGRRTTGSTAGHFALVGPGWNGELPDGVRPVERSPTPWVLVAGRTLVDGAEDVPAVRALQRQYQLTPLSLWGTDRQVPERREVFRPIPSTQDPLGPWKTLNAMLAENPPPPEHAILLKQFATIGIGPGLDVDDQPETVKESLGRAFGAGMRLLKEHFLSGSWATVVNGWRYPPPNEGRFGDELLYRAADQSLAGIVANDPAEAVYLVNFSDDNGARFSGDHRYELKFTGDNLPPVDAFWSLTMYAADYNLVANPANRYSIGDRTPGLARDADGGMTLYIQAASPGGDKESNWLPCPAEGTWFIILRMYQPHDEVVQATWRCPAVRNVG